VRVLVLNGVNLDVVGLRDPELYGGLSLGQLESRIYEWARQLEIHVECRQTNSEGEYVEWCHDAHGRADAVIVNPGAWSHYSWAIHDALELLEVPIVEVHLSNVDEREDWRRFSVVSSLARTRIVGKGPDGYREALAFVTQEGS
jgi:3-dehydroquinate dehydratase-2